MKLRLVNFRCYSDSSYQIQHPSQDCNYLITNLTESPDNEKIKFYPNPFSSQLIIELPQIINSKYFLKLYNSMGQIIKSETITQSSNIDVSELKQGVYFCEISNKGAVLQRKKLVKN